MTNQKLIFLCGFMGCGKTTHGKKLAKVFSYTFIDLDKKIEQLTKLTVSELFELKGENEFRNIETECLKKVIANSELAVISLGGGTPCFNNNIELIKKSGLLVYIKMDPKSLYKRLKQASYQRPLLKGKTEKELLDYISELLINRENFYNQAHISINGLNLNDTLLKQSIEAYYS